MWLLVGFEDNEDNAVSSFKLKQPCLTLNLQNSDIIGDAFDVPTWKGIYDKYGAESFDAIVTDGGLYNMRRVDAIICIKQGLLKPDGCIYNYTSIIGEKVEDPIGRGFKFYKISKRNYTVEGHDAAWNSLTPTSWSQYLRKRVKLIV